MDLHNKSEETQDLSEEENDLNLINVKSNRKKNLDSDSEVDELPSKGTIKSVKEFAADKENSEVEPTNALSKTDNEISNNLISSSNAEYTPQINHDKLNANIIHRKKTKRFAILDSDSEDESNVQQLETDVEQSSNVLENQKRLNKNEDNHDNVLVVNEHSHESNPEESVNNRDSVKPKTKPKRVAILDSDSENESNTKHLETDAEQSSNILENQKHLNENEDNDDNMYAANEEPHESNSEETADNNATVKPKPKLKRIAIIDSDSEDEVPVTPHNRSFNDELDTPHTSNDKSVYVVNAKGNLVIENNPEVLQDDTLKKSLAALCSSESSGDEDTYTSSRETQTHVKPFKKRASKASTEEPSGKKMTGKQALQQRQEIRSESQRMLRESRISLPYHKPKARSIREFLQNRPRLSIMKTDNAPPSLAMKMSVQELEVVTKKLEERKKVVQEFYKSESESDEEEAQSEDPKIVDTEACGDSNKEIIGINSTNENTEMETVENGEPVINSEEQENFEICSNSKVGENIEETVQDSNTQSGEANFESSQMEVDVDIPENNSDATEKTQEIMAAMNVSEETKNADASATDVEQEMALNGSEDESKVPESGNSDLKKNESDIYTDDDNIYKAQEGTLTSAGEPEASSTNPVETSKEIQESDKQQNSILEQSENSVEFDFNLDGLDEDFSEDFAEVPESKSETTEKNSKPEEKNMEEEHLQRLLKKYEDASDNDGIKSAPTSEKKLNRIDLLKQIGPTKPSLSGGPDEIIDLDEGITKPSGVAKLMERFMKHALTKNVPKNKVQLDIINLTQGEVIRETVAMSVDPEEELVAIVETPGIKLKKLRDELQSQIAQRRSELWQQKHQPLGESVNKEICGDEKSECGADEDILDDEEEAELTDIEDEEDEEEYEEQLSKKPEKPRVKSAFIDEEAEETDDDDDNDDQVSLKGEECDADEECNGDVEDNVDELNEEEHTNESQSTTTKKPLRRILRGFTEDSDEEESSEAISNSQIVKENTEENKNTSFTSLNSTDTLDDDDIPPNQPRTDKTPHKDLIQSKTAVLGLLTPVQHLTGLQGFNSGSKFLHEESPVSPFLLPPDPSPLKDKHWNKDLQKKLFSDSCDTLDFEANMEDIAQLCSGKFSSQTQEVAVVNSTCTVVETLATQDVINMCSGSFSGITPVPKIHQEEYFNDLLPRSKEANIETDILISTGSITQVNLNSNTEIKSLDDDRLISQLLDEEEMEQFKKKFESPVAPVLSNIDDCDLDVEVQAGGRLVSDSSDNEDEEPKHKNTKKLQKRLAFSDDSESEEEANIDNEEINLHDDCLLDDFGDDDTNANIDYDSEENEIELDNQEEVPRQKLRPSDFLENEAELSESDWDSADEDEKGLDALEFEQGDAEVFDENKMRSDLEKIHMRRVLDQDNQEIKILQELLLEDGELHGTGRQRQFRWRNIDDAENEDGQGDAEVEAYLDEEESEEQWRRARHQREMFLKEKHISLENDDFISTDSDSQVLKLGQEAVRKSLSAVPAVSEIPKATTSSPVVKKPLMLLNTRGSFLARTDNFLSKLAEFTKVTTTPTVGAPKNATKFVFQTVSQTTLETGANKRKLQNADKTPKILKKLRLSSNLTPVVKNVDRKKKLF